MRVLFDFSAIKEGGGTQLALNFLQVLPNRFPEDWHADILLPDRGSLAQVKAPLPGSKLYQAPSHPLKRLRFEHGECQHIICSRGVDVIFTFFGPGLPHPAFVKSIVCAAYPIICYPESPYWRHVELVAGLKKRVLNHFRRIRLKQATLIVVETEIMKKRIAGVLGLHQDCIRVLKPSVSNYVNARLQNHHEGPFMILCLSGLSPHKNLWRLYEVASLLNRQGLKDIKFMLSTTKDGWLRSLKERQPFDSAVMEMFEFSGAVHPSNINDLYQRADALLSLSDLESFSNNYMEAWKAGLPLIASDRDFAREICKDSAIYVEPHNCRDIANKITELASSSELRNKLIRIGKGLLFQLPTLDERVSNILDLLRH